MNIDMDDPLGLGDLSEGSNDSFFEDPKVLSKRRASIQKTPEKKVISSIFNLSEDAPAKPTQETPPIEKNIQTPIEISKPPTPVRGKSARKISFSGDDNDIDDDLLGNLGLQSEKSQELRKNPEKKLATSLDDLLKDVKPQPRALTQPVVKFDTEQMFSLSSSEVPKGRRGRRRSSSGLMDPLGLFGKESEEDKRDSKARDVEDSGISTETIFPIQSSKQSHSKSTSSIPTEVGLPEWLSGSSSILSKPHKSNVEISHQNPIPSEIKSAKSDTTNTPTLSAILKHQPVSQNDLEYQQSLTGLQQQESQLLMALHLKKYEENLQEIQRQQQEVIKKQEQQFNYMLERYFERQHLMEDNLKLQQERINNYIQMLIGRESEGAIKSRTVVEQSVDRSVEDASEGLKYHENISNVIKQRHQEELFLLEESYKKQISILEQQRQSLEERLHSELITMEQSYENKLKKMKENNEKDVESYRDKLRKVEEEHVSEIQLLRDNQKRVVTEIKIDHVSQIENLRKLKEHEDNLLGDGRNYSEKLEHSLEVLGSNSRLLQGLHLKVEKDYGVLTLARESAMQVKEGEIERSKESLTKFREVAEQERSQLLTLIQNLETRISEQNHTLMEEKWSLQQAVAILTAKSTALDRETEFHRAVIERERQQIKTLKDALLEEQQKIVAELTEEKLAMATKAAQMEITNKLTNDFEVKKCKAEAEAATKIAKEAAEMMEGEREHLQKQRLELERFRRQLTAKESELLVKDRELDQAIIFADRRFKEGEHAMAQARELEAKYGERMRELQMQLGGLAHREKRLAEEKMALSRERVSFYTTAKQYGTRKCALCSSEEGHEDFIRSSEFRNIADPDAIRFRLEVLEDERASEVSKED